MQGAIGREAARAVVGGGAGGLPTLPAWSGRAHPVVGAVWVVFVHLVLDGEARLLGAPSNHDSWVPATSDAQKVWGVRDYARLCIVSRTWGGVAMECGWRVQGCGSGCPGHRACALADLQQGDQESQEDSVVSEHRRGCARWIRVQDTSGYLLGRQEEGRATEGG
eukprot:132229-Chlamydomonas_euryale.AAC.1